VDLAPLLARRPRVAASNAAWRRLH